MPFLPYLAFLGLPRGAASVGDGLGLAFMLAHLPVFEQIDSDGFREPGQAPYTGSN
jgi:hypothetical protein